MMFAQQEHRCAICNIPERYAPNKRLVVDHDHKTKKVRALLCNSCNVLLGAAYDSPAVLEKAISYLRAFK